VNTYVFQVVDSTNCLIIMILHKFHGTI